MTNSIALTNTAGTGLVSREDLVRSLNNTAMEIPVNGSGVPYLKMDKNNGQFFYGQEETEVEEGSLWAANPMSLKKGWVAWDRNDVGASPVAEIMVPYVRELPSLSSLPPLGMSKPNKKTGLTEQLTYQQQYAVDFVCVTGEDEGTVVEYKQSSGGALKMFGKLTNAILAQAQNGDEIVPIGKFNFESYPNKTYGGKTFNPLFDIVEWRTMDDGTKPAEAEAPKAEAPKAAAKAQEPAADAEEEQLAAEYAAEQQAASSSEERAPRRRVRR